MHLVWIAVGFLALTAHAQAQESTSCRQFAQGFYSWYVSIIHEQLNGPAFDVVLRERSYVLSPGLLRALKTDSEAQRHAQGEIVGIDFDPFVGGQDPADRYDLRNVTIKGGKCFIEVWRASPNDKSAKSIDPDAIVQLSNKTGHWSIEDIQYPEVKADLMEVLATLEKERQSKR